MARVKNKRNAGLADKVHGKKKAEFKKKINPFEVHINREKIKVLGKKSKHDKGLPGVSRAKAIQKRKETIGTEMKLMHKTNAFIDRRIGEKNNQLSAEDRMVARFAAERAKQHTKKSLYNLADDEILTHRGQTLEQIEKFDDPRSSDEEGEEGKGFGGLDNDFVSDGHFGGGMLSKTDSKDGAKSHKDLIEQLIAESKKRKAEKQKEKEQTLDLTEKLDSEWKDLQPVVFKHAKEEESIIDKVLSKADQKNKDYDKMMRELRFEKRGTPSDGLKSDEKQAEEERKKLEQWERERQQRMLEEEPVRATVVPAAKKHRSAEDLDDNFDLDYEQDFMLAYDKDGKPLVPEHVLKDYSVPNAKRKFDDGVSDTSSDNDEEETDDDGTNDDDVSQKNETKATKRKSSDTESSEDGDTTEDDSNNSGEKKRKLNDNDANQKNEIKAKKLKSRDTDSSDDEVGTTGNVINNTREKNCNINDNPDSNSKHDKATKFITRQRNAKDSVVKSEEKVGLFQNDDVDSEESDESDDQGDEGDEEDEEDDDVSKDDLKDLRVSDVESCDEVEVEVDTEKIGSFFDFKLAEGDNLKELLTGKTPAQQSTAIQKLIKSYDPSLAENNKDLLSRLFAHLLQYTNDLFTNLTQEGEVMKAFLTFDRLVPHLYDLAVTNKVSTKKYLVDVLKEKHDRFKKYPKKVPDLDTLIFFKLVSLLYPTSDFRHPVTTPSLVFMSEILTLSRFNDPYSISRGFFIISLILEYTVLSKRLVPSSLNFLRGILYLCANTSIVNPIQVVPPFRLHKDGKILNLERDCSKMAAQNKMAGADFVLKELTDSFKIQCLLACVVMMKEMFDHFEDVEAQECMFESHIQLLGRVDLDMYPKKVARIAGEILQYMREKLEMKTYTPLSSEKKRPKALRLYEPDVQEVFTGSKSGKMSRECAERARLQARYKREMKGALREIRRDKSFIGSVKIRQKIHSDNVRKQKVKQIYKDAAIQQGELNKLKRIK